MLSTNEEERIEERVEERLGLHRDQTVVNFRFPDLMIFYLFEKTVCSQVGAQMGEPLTAYFGGQGWWFHTLKGDPMTTHYTMFGFGWFLVF